MLQSPTSVNSGIQDRDRYSVDRTLLLVIMFDKLVSRIKPKCTSEGLICEAIDQSTDLAPCSLRKQPTCIYLAVTGDVDSRVQ